jgi:two-component system phosphate regulon sensor histidine kinase PhoR
VANVSHELRTPLTSIQGFAETLLNPEVNDPEQIKKFLEIIHRHAARLGAIIEDLLALSRIERDVEDRAVELTLRPIRPTLFAAVELCEVRAKAKDISINVDCDGGIESHINPPLLEQALVNLIDNALKYSEPTSKVDVRVVSGAEGNTLISVRDFGQGIPQEHLPRLFERFYRVDKARSRKMGGTGLGLSIVKHITLAHQGTLGVESQQGQGTTFKITLPSAHP